MCKMPILFSGLLLFAVSCTSPYTRPPWVDVPGANQFVGGASYEVFSELRARQNAIAKAIAGMILLKSGKAEVVGTVEHEVVSILGNSGETVREQSVVETTARLEGKEIPIRVKVLRFWNNPRSQRIWVLIEDQNP